MNLPAYLQNTAARPFSFTAALDANLGAGSPPSLSIMGNRFTLVDAVGEEHAVPTYDPKTGPYIDCIIIDVLERTSKIYYDKPYDPAASQFEPPVCWSDNGVGPSRNAAKPQSRTCVECPLGAWGSKTSAVSGKGVKACSDVQKIAIMVPGYETPFLFRLPAGSRNNLRDYNHKFKGQKFEICDVLSRLTFEQGAIGVVKFDAAGWLDEQNVVPLRNKLMESKATDSMVGRTDLPRADAGLAAPAAQPQLAAPQEQPVPFASAPMSIAVPVAEIQAAQSASIAAAQPAPHQRRRRRNTAEQSAQQPAPQGAAPFMPQVAPAGQAPFMSQTATPAQPAQPAQPNGFGMATPAGPSAEIEGMLNSVFGE